MAQITAKFVFQLPFYLKMQEVRGIKPASVKRNGEDITIYPPVHTEKDMTEKPFSQLKTPKPRKTQLDKLNCIVIDIRRDFPNIQQAKQDSEALLAKAREIVYQLLNLCRKQRILHIGDVNTEKLNYRIILFNANGNKISSAGQTHLTLKTIPFGSSQWADICQDWATGKLAEIYEIFLLDAKNTAFDEPRRAVLDTAIACEVFIKNFCEVARKNKNISKSKYKKMLKKSKGENGEQGEILFYFDKILECLVGRSLKQDNLDLYEKINCLRLTSNSIKHEGKCEYEKGRKVTKVKYHEVYDFITAVQDAIEYTRLLKST